MLLAGILVLIGLAMRQRRRYWMGAASAVALQLVMFRLLGADGPVAAAVRRSAGEGLVATLWEPSFVVLAWALPVAIAVRGYSVRRRLSSARLGELH